ncbi:phosphocholine-specific phospholipase C [Arcticibacter tournemirensis]|uniref:phospholipase C n=1 Tax=Arcticibacter tournemirensis TaxID=699437 RepID=A0A4Q0M4I5_9SPHI|nr:phospholipase C, phosphocholine-specific [Arcticibacter tournemirensis]RXF67870.1 phospholipase C, phosphocholine-specific [Arcticibacter tournemirensis]
MTTTESRREFIKKAGLLAGAAGLFSVFPSAIQKALAIEADPGTTYLDAEHVVFLMQENRSFDHCYGALKGVRGFNDPRAIELPNRNPVWLQTNTEGKTFAPFRLDIKNSKATWMGSLPHSWSDQVDARNNGRFDTWLTAKKAGNKDYSHMPLTLGYYDRQDIPFYYALADAFTVCDQHFCSSLTGTSANRSYFWSGIIRENPHDEKSKAHVWNHEINYKDVNWPTFPERLEQAGISWKVYQNELSVPVGFNDEEDNWLANFTDNNLEFHKQYHVRFHPAHLAWLEERADNLPGEIKSLEDKLESKPSDSNISKELDKKKSLLNEVMEARKTYNKEAFERLPDFEKSIHRRAFVTNEHDPDYHKLSTIHYEEHGENREVKVPEGDIFHQFRLDAENNRLPAVSWLVAPCAFSDHPGSPWYGAWYVSEALDILTKNPDIWKKTIFILTYDENDGYFDHVPPFTPPHSARPETGAVSKGIDTRAEWVTMDQEKARTDNVGSRRESPIGLGYRVPLVIASPWTKGGWVNSEVFDLTSSLQFLEHFLSSKTGKAVREPNITDWRRTVCGDLSSVFRPLNKENIAPLSFLKRDEVIEGIFEAQFKPLPGNFKALNAEEIRQVRENPSASSLLPGQEKGVRPACAIPYELYADSRLNKDRKKVVVSFRAGKEVFGEKSAGAAFNVYSPVKFRLGNDNDYETMHNWSFAVKAGDVVSYEWDLGSFENGTYNLRSYGVNGFFREFYGDAGDPEIEVTTSCERINDSKSKISQNLILNFKNKSSSESYRLEIEDKSYGAGKIAVVLPPASALDKVINLKKSSGWYDLSIKANGFSTFGKRYAGHVENGKGSISDPLMGRVTL